MKKLINIIFAVMASCAVLSCGSDVEIPEKPDTPVTPEKPEKPEEPEDPGFGGDVTFTATIESLSDGSQPSWKKGESISIFDGTSTVKSANTEADGPVAKFPATIKKGTEGVFALYPANDGVQLSATGVLLDVPVEQSTTEAVPAYRVAKGKNDLLYFRNLVAVLKLSVEFDGVTSVVIQADDAAKIAGTLSVDYAGESPVLAASSSKIEVKGEFKKGEVYPVVLAPATLDKCTVEAYVEGNVVARLELEKLTLTPGTVLDLSSLKSANPVYKITHLWLWGGTGPEWEGTEVYDLYSKEELFNSEDGRGVAALKDNYLVFNADGTFNNWAGEDGRNWWHIYNGTKNPETGVDLDLSSFYEVLPRSVGTFIKEENAITFTRPDGTISKAELVPEGDYTMPVPPTDPNGKPISSRVISITNQALRFEITGTRDLWGDLMYNGYNVVAVHPRQLFIELEKMPDGFTVPDASKTTDADYKFVPPVYEFDFDALPGTWNVYGGNSAPFGFWVNGGSGSDPGLICPIEKDWCWNDSVLKESDNTLTIAITGLSASTASGTFNWEAGADGAFWDCIWNRLRGVASDSHFGEDLSKFFSPIPKGLSNVTVDLKTGAGKIGSDIDFTFLTPGGHPLTCGKSITIPNGCFALAFHISDPIAETVDVYQDVDRFVNAPLDYVIIFEKK